MPCKVVDDANLENMNLFIFVSEFLSLNFVLFGNKQSITNSIVMTILNSFRCTWQWIHARCVLYITAGFTVCFYPDILAVIEKNNPESTRVNQSVHTALLGVRNSLG